MPSPSPSTSTACPTPCWRRDTAALTLRGEQQRSAPRASTTLGGAPGEVFAFSRPETLAAWVLDIVVDWQHGTLQQRLLHILPLEWGNLWKKLFIAVKPKRIEVE